MLFTTEFEHNSQTELTSAPFGCSDFEEKDLQLTKSLKIVKRTISKK